jgi:CubicO group peptidase (beta-lactamase class C family)
VKRLFIIGVGLAVWPGSVNAQNPAVRHTDSSLVAYVTTEVPRLMKELSIPGAVVTLVQHDRVIMNRGFGVADVARGIPVDPDSTEFRVASVAKVFTALAVLQQVESGQVQVNADIRPLLSDMTDRLGERPLTLHQLLTTPLASMSR